MLEIEEENLGAKHKRFNELVKEAIVDNKPFDSSLLLNEGNELKNLIYIDVANKNKNENFILKVLTCDDILYVTRALKNCGWMISDDKYSHVINPVYISKELYPRMQAKAITRFKQVLRKHMNNESRAEEFIQNEPIVADAAKWLPKCSMEFIKKNFSKYITQNTPFIVIKLLCEKSLTFLEMFIEAKMCNVNEILERIPYLIRRDVNKYLDIVESLPSYNTPRFGKRATKFLMTECPERILRNFKDYCDCIEVSTLVKCLKREDLTKFLYKQATSAIKGNTKLKSFFLSTDNWNLFMKAMDENEMVQFIETVFINELEQDNESESNNLREARQFMRLSQKYTPVYYWYQFFSFEVTFPKLTFMIDPATQDYDKGQIMEVIMTSTKGNLIYAKRILQYFQDKHMNSSVYFKTQFLDKFISIFKTQDLDQESRTILYKIIDTMDIFNNLDSSLTIIGALIINKLVHNENVPIDLEKQFKFNTLETLQNKLNTKEKEIVFNYQVQLIWKRIEQSKTDNTNELTSYVDLIKSMMILLKGWNKNITDYPLLLEKIKQLLVIKRDKSNALDLSSLYNVEKSWRKYLFNESIILSPTEETCMNSLKHYPGLLKVYKKELEYMFFKDTLSFTKLYWKVRIYWPTSICKDWTEMFLNKLEETEAHRAVTHGLCVLLPSSRLVDILKQHIPINANIELSQIEEHELSLQRNFAKNMHRARPQPPIESMLWYAKGDYLQYALPSLLAMFYNISSIQFTESLPQILDAPVSLQKHGVRFIFTKLPPEVLKQTIKELWSKSTNKTIRNEIFLNTHKLLCKEESGLKISDNWNLLEVFIDNLSFEENKSIYRLLYSIKDIPQIVKPNFFMKAYNFLKELIANDKNEYSAEEWDIRIVARQSRDVMELLPPRFVADLISELILEDLYKAEVGDSDIQILSSYLLCNKDENSETKKYDEFFAPILKRFIEHWNRYENGVYIARHNFSVLVSHLIADIKIFTTGKKMFNPVKMFSKIQFEIEKSLPLSENYILIRVWQLATHFVKLLDKRQSHVWEEDTCDLAPEFGLICLEYLRNDTKSYFPDIYILFAKVVSLFKKILSENVQYQVYKCFVNDESFIAGYLTVIKLIGFIRNHDNFNYYFLKQNILTHPSMEVRMHFYKSFY